MRNFWIVTSLALAGCATPATQTVWHYPGLDQRTAERQFQIDGAECRALAKQAVPTPELPSSASETAEPPTYRVSGTVMSSNGSMSFYQGRATPSGRNLGFWGAYAQEAANHQYIRDMHSADRERRQFADACMLKRGWEQSTSR